MSNIQILPRSGQGNGSTVDRGGGPPDNPSMEIIERVAHLETDMRDVRERMARVETTLNHIEREVSSTKWWILGQIVAGLLTVIGTGVAIQQMTVATFQAAGAQAAPTQPAPIVIQMPAAAPTASK